VSVGDDVVVIGAPYGRALSVSSGIVSQLETSDGGAQTAMKTDAAIGYGASGGGVFDVPRGRLVGLVEGYRTARVSFTGVRNEDLGFDVPMPGETFLAPPTKIRRFLRRAGVARLAGLDPALPTPARAAPPKASAEAEP
jgi:S1-C subfamily serine protease